jgi:hypothetical protein
MHAISKMLDWAAVGLIFFGVGGRLAFRLLRRAQTLRTPNAGQDQHQG